MLIFETTSPRHFEQILKIFGPNEIRLSFCILF